MSDPPRAPLTTTTSLWPAFAVVGLAVVMLVTFLVVNLLANQGVTKETTTTIPVVVGGLALNPSPGPSLTYCNQSEEVPANVADAFVVPAHTSLRPGAATPNAGAGDFDCVQPFVTAGASAAALLNFFSAQLGARGWSLFSTGASNGGPQDLFQKAGDDGFYWVVGVTVTKATSSSVRWSFRIYQNSETV